MAHNELMDAFSDARPTEVASSGFTSPSVVDSNSEEEIIIKMTGPWSREAFARKIVEEACLFGDSYALATIMGDFPMVEFDDARLWLAYIKTVKSRGGAADNAVMDSFRSVPWTQLLPNGAPGTTFVRTCATALEPLSEKRGPQTVPPTPGTLLQLCSRMGRPGAHVHAIAKLTAVTVWLLGTTYLHESCAVYKQWTGNHKTRGIRIATYLMLVKHVCPHPPLSGMITRGRAHCLRAAEKLAGEAIMNVPQEEFGWVAAALLMNQDEDSEQLNQEVKRLWGIAVNVFYELHKEIEESTSAEDKKVDLCYVLAKWERMYNDFYHDALEMLGG
ncbi:hypothetical protein AURDEDRAFT_131924 [Auricularia subglabra TFB-10046 SS5]|uniref:Uncharacterized protein n=1 Tax=Auricularia subglabra (strain TFB-10046 / SS5) TaxID=717982 RepID=J0D2T2_AURST|nr:hypothetical protein AURDEDRAFT_131924 [Auricularia subglabra TFB-10046 SS5]